MSYNPVTDFIALLRATSGGVRTERMPGLDYVIAAMARAGMFTLSVSQTPPTSNQATTVWFRPSVPSWVTEGVVFLWNAAAAEYEQATIELWQELLGSSGGGGGGYVFQSVTTGAGIVNGGTSLLAIERAAPATTTLTLPTLISQGTKQLQIVDWSSAVTAHDITLNPVGGATIMKANSWDLLSSAVQLAGVTLQPSPDLNAWIIAP